MENTLQVDFISPDGAAQGSVAQKLLQCNFNVNSLRPYHAFDKNRNYAGVFVNSRDDKSAIRVNTAATLLYDEWKLIDTMVVKIFRERLRGIEDLMRAGLVKDIGNGLSKTVFQYQNASDITGATMSMDGLVRGNNDRPHYDIVSLPLPIVHKDFQIDARLLAESRNGNMPIDTVMAELASRKIAEYLEDLLFLGSGTYTYGGGTIYGYLDYPHTNSYTLSVGWDESGATGETILADVIGMKQAMINDRRYGPFTIYIPTAYETVLDGEFKDSSDKTVRQRLLEIEGISSIRVADHLTSGKVLMVQFTSDTLRLIQGLPIKTVQWDEQGGMSLNFKIMTIMVPQFMADQDGRCGIVVASAP